MTASKTNDNEGITPVTTTTTGTSDKLIINPPTSGITTSQPITLNNDIRDIFIHKNLYDQWVDVGYGTGFRLQELLCTEVDDEGMVFTLREGKIIRSDITPEEFNELIKGALSVSQRGE